MPDVFTVYNCGTAFNRQRTDELVANLASRTQGAENRDWLVNDGPGSAPTKPTGPFPADRTRAAQAKTPGRPAGDINPAFITQAKGIVTGHGWEQNVAHTVQVLEAIATGSGTPRTVNMVGWSRGSITCHMLAHALHEHPRFTGVQVNIFAVDPVAGPLSSGDSEKTTIPPNVNEYVTIAMEDESRFIMRPSLPAAHQAGGSRHRVYPMPGNHSAAVMLHEGPVAEITHNLALDFLKRHGTALSSQFLLAPDKTCELYAIVRLTLERYRAGPSPLQAAAGAVAGVIQGIVPGPAGRLAAGATGAAAAHLRPGTRVPNPQRTKAFLNAHHERVFRAAYANLASYISSGGGGAPPTRDLARIKSRWEATHRWVTDVVGVK